MKRYYTRLAEKEWKRLESDAYHLLEFATTLGFLEKYLPKKGAILDAGGGPGRYSIELAKRGYAVILLDVTPACLEVARRESKKAGTKLQAIVEGSITDLSMFGDGTFDAVICLGGPLSHVLDAGKRRKAARELMRVAKKGAPVIVSVMGRLAVLQRELQRFQNEIGQRHFPIMRDTGDYAGGSGFTACHFFLAEDLRELFEKGADAKVLEMAGLEGVAANLEKEVNRLARNGRRWKVWLETHAKLCTRPSVVDTSGHILLVCRKT